MDISLLNTLKTVEWDFRRDMAQSYANALKNAIELHLPNNKEKQQGFFLSKKGCSSIRGNFEDKLYVGNIHQVESHLYWNDEELQDDDEIVNVVVIDGPVTRDGGGCSYGTKDYRDQVMYANTIPQVVGHLFLINTPGGESACRNDYDMMIGDCREKGKWTVGLVDGMCCSSGVNLSCRLDRVIVMNPKDDFGCIGSMAAFWATPDGAIDRDGTRYIEIVGEQSPEKNDWYREAAQGNYEKLKEIIDKDTEEFHQTVRENRPLVKAEHLTGKVFEAQELIPALVDEIGGFDRAIECIFELRDGKLASARKAVVIPGEQPAGSPEPGPETEDTTHQIDNDMTEQEKKMAQEAEAATAATQVEAPVTEQPAETPKPEAGAPADEEKEQPAEEQGNNGDEKPAEEAPANDEKPAAEEAPADENGAAEAPAANDDAEKSGEPDGKVEEALHAAEQTIADRDKEIASLKETLATLNGIAEERDAAVKERDERDDALAKSEQDYAEQGKALTDAEAKIAEQVATIEKLQKQVKELQAEVKELSGTPSPMTNGDSGVPAGNGTGEAPKVSQHQRIKPGMSYEEIRKITKEK